MTRGTPAFHTGTLPTVGSGQVNNIYNVIIDIAEGLQSFQSNGVIAWQGIDVISSTSGSQDRVVHSVGDRTLGADVVSPFRNNGDIDAFIRIIQVNATQIDLRAYQDYADFDSTFQRESSTTSSATLFGLSDTAAVEWALILNEYEFWFVMKQGGSVDWLGFGSPRRWATNKIKGTARVTVASSAIGDVLFSIDRDITSEIQIGQRVWITNRTPPGQGVVSDHTEILEVSFTNSTPNQITLLGVTKPSVLQPYQIGTLIGLDPTALFVFGAATANPTIHMTSNNDASYSGLGLQTANFEHLGNLMTESSMDPGPSQLFQGFKTEIDMTGAGDPRKGLRGFPEMLAFFAGGVQGDFDRMLPELDPAQAYKVFSSLVAVGWFVGIGPGAT